MDSRPRLGALLRPLARLGDYARVLLLLLPLWAAQAGLAHFLFQVAGHPLPFRSVLAESATLFLAVSLLAPLALWAAHAYPLDAGTWFRRLPQHTFLLLVFCALDYVVERSLYALADASFAGVRSRLTFLSQGPEGFLATLCLAAPFYVLIVAARHAQDYHHDLQERALRSAQLEAQFSETRLQTLKAQLQPHFLFNALNAIYGYIPPEGETAQRMVVLLSTFLRRSLQEMGLQQVPLRHEVETVGLYLEIQQLRFANRLSVAWDVAEDTLDQDVPHLVLQPLVENALKHGLTPKLEPGTVTIRARRDGACLTLEVADDGVGPGQGTLGTGVGLANLRKRLQHLYGDRAALAAGPQEEGGFLVRIQLPIPRG